MATHVPRDTIIWISSRTNKKKNKVDSGQLVSNLVKVNTLLDIYAQTKMQTQASNLSQAAAIHLLLSLFELS